MRHLLHAQAERIEMVLASHRVRGQVRGGTVTPRFVRFQLSTALGTRISQVTRLSEEIALALGSRSCRVYRREGALNVEVPREDPTPVHLLTICQRLPSLPPCSAVLGLDEEGVPLLLRLPSPEVAHVLVAGTTGCGKTALARSMALSLALHAPPREVQLLLVDPKGHNFAPFEGLPHLLRPVVREVGGALEVLHRLAGEMERRGAQGVCRPRIVVVLDELADLVMVGGREMEEVLTRLAQRGREAGVHLVACTQKPAAAVIGGLVKSNFPVRVVGSVASANDAWVAAGVGGSGAERLLGRGDFLLVARGEVLRFQAAWVGPREVEEAVRELGANGRRKVGPRRPLRSLR